MKMKKMIVLASASPRRRELLKQMGIKFAVETSVIDETVHETEPSRIVEQLALKKAEDVFKRIRQNNEVIVIGADTIVTIDEEILGKPSDEKEAFRMLKKLQGRTHSVYTGVALYWQGEDKLTKTGDTPPEQGLQEVCFESFSVETKVTFYPMTDEEISLYAASGEPLDKAGAYGIQGKAAIFVKQIEGDYYNVVGLPIGELYRSLKKFL